jgi:DNA polymerase-3 subunit gamma/tau
VELSRDGSGSLDVVEIDAASHNGVDDARDLRERAIFAPARDRYKIFILDEAHMVTPQGFNALLKIVEEPPAHVKFIFATTEPDKVIGTIRSRTHHYPFRLVPPAQMLEYLEQLCVSENVDVAPGVLSLVVRSGGGSVRDSLSLLDQLIAGSEGGKVEYDRAAALLGFTHAALLDEVVDAFGAKNSASVFASVDKVIQTGQDPRRFVEDLLEHLRDLIVILSVGEEAKNVLRGIPTDELEKMKTQALSFGLAELTHAAETVNTALTEMSGATSPKLHLELMCAKVLVPSSDQTEVGSLARIERLERRIGVGGAGGAGGAEGTAAVAVPVQATAPSAAAPAASAAPKSAPKSEKISEVSTPAGIGGVTLTQFKDSWPNILTIVNKKSKAAWMVAFALNVIDFTGDVLTLKFLSQKDLDSFKNANGASEVLRGAIMDVLGVQVKFKAQIDAKPEDAPVAAPAAPVSSPAPVKVETTPIAVVAEAEPEVPAEAAVEETKSRNSGMADESARYGESLLREMLGAEPMQDKNGK